MTKNKLRQRLIDICNGAGYTWIEADEYFEAQYDLLESVGKSIEAIERAFEFPAETRLRTPWALKEFNSMDTLVELVNNVINFDIKD